MAAALVGGADAVGLSSASAATSVPKARMVKLPTGGYGIAARTASDLPGDCRCRWQCTHVSCGCGGCCGSGTCCFQCVRIRNVGGKCRGNYSICLSQAEYGCGTVYFCGA